MAYLRPIVFKIYGPREGYDPLKEPTSQDMGSSWFALVYGLLLGLHTFWFFLLEIFELGRFGFILQKTLFSGVLSFLLALLIQSFILFFYLGNWHLPVQAVLYASHRRHLDTPRK
jgi:hypothetical protein